MQGAYNASSITANLVDVKGGILDARNKELHTVFGKGRRAVVVATILHQSFVSSAEAGEGKKSRASYVLDDGTAVIRGTWFGVDADEAMSLDTGDIVVALLRFSEYKNEVSFYIDRMRKINRFSEEIHHRLSVARRKAALIAAGKPIVLADAGTITNRDDESQFFFPEGGGSFDDVDSFETPIDFTSSNEPIIPVERAASRDAPASKGVLQGKDDDLDTFEDEALKDILMETLFELDASSGVTVDQLEAAVPQGRAAIVKVLKIMENEQSIRRVATNPDAYRPF